MNIYSSPNYPINWNSFLCCTYMPILLATLPPAIQRTHQILLELASIHPHALVRVIAIVQQAAPNTALSVQITHTGEWITDNLQIRTFAAELPIPTVLALAHAPNIRMYLSSYRYSACHCVSDALSSHVHTTGALCWTAANWTAANWTGIVRNN